MQSKPAEQENRTAYFDSALLDPDHDENTSFPLFPSLPQDAGTMNGQAAPIDIATRQTSVSPPGQQASNLTSALQKAANSNNERVGSIPSASGANNGVALKTAAVRKDSLGASMAQWGNGTKPISVSGSNRDKPRRESLAGSLVGGMSWGGVSVGSWIRDEYVFPAPRGVVLEFSHRTPFASRHNFPLRNESFSRSEQFSQSQTLTGCAALL